MAQMPQCGAAERRYDTTFPTYEGCNCDLAILETMLLEKFTRHAPEIELYKLLVSDEAHQGTVLSSAEVAAGYTAVDDLWGEAIPDTVADTWAQPHDDAVADAPNPEKFTDTPYILNFRLKKQKTKKTNTKWGVDKVVVVEGRALQKQLRDKGVWLEPGDQFVWYRSRYRIEWVEYDAGRWAAPFGDAFMYADFQATSLRRGS